MDTLKIWTKYKIYRKIAFWSLPEQEKAVLKMNLLKLGKRIHQGKY